MSRHFPPPRNDPKETQIQRLVKKTGCDPLLCQEALVHSQGSLFSALLHLEQEGHTSPPKHPNGGCFSTKETWATLHPPPAVEEDVAWSEPSFQSSLKHEILENRFQIWKGRDVVFQMPVVCLVLLFPLTYGSLVLLLFLPLFFGIHYRFSSEGSFLSEFNPIVRRTSTYLSKSTRIFRRKS